MIVNTFAVTIAATTLYCCLINKLGSLSFMVGVVYFAQVTIKVLSLPPLGNLLNYSGSPPPSGLSVFNLQNWSNLPYFICL